MAIALAGCSRSNRVVEVELEQLPHPATIYVDFQGGMGHGTSHYVTDPSVVARIDVLVNADRGGWRDIIKEWGKSPIRHATLEWSAGDAHSTLDVGDGWIMRGALLQNIPPERSKEILQLIGDQPAGF
jgi:hypothetical protein